MKIGVIAENPIEWVLHKAGKLPAPFIDTFQALALARTLMAGAQLGVFEALSGGPLTASELAAKIGTNARATEKLLNALVGTRYLRYGEGRYGLGSLARKWLLPDTAQSLHESLLFRYVEWDIMGGYEEFIRTGKPLDVHAALKGEEEWNLYQRGMRSIAGLAGREVARRLPVGRAATTMLDIGGSHGYFSVAICRRHPALRATILDLPEAVKHAAAILARENMGDRVVHRPGDVLTEDLGEANWDVVFISHLVHHFDAATNLAIAERAARALKPGGLLAIQEVIRPASPTDVGQTGALMDLYFALTSLSGTWSIEEIAGWQAKAGLRPNRPIKLLTAPGVALQTAVKPKAA